MSAEPATDEAVPAEDRSRYAGVLRFYELAKHQEWLVKDVPYMGSREVDYVGAILSIVGMGGIVLGILVWQEGGESVAALILLGAAAMAVPAVL